MSVCSCEGVSEKHIPPGLGPKDALKVEKDTFFWDSELAGFGVRVHPSGRKVYVVQTRAGDEAAKRVTVGRHGVITAEEARRRAAQIIARIKAGEDPVPALAVRRIEGSRRAPAPPRPRSTPKRSTVVLTHIVSGPPWLARSAWDRGTMKRSVP